MPIVVSVERRMQPAGGAPPPGQNAVSAVAPASLLSVSALATMARAAVRAIVTAATMDALCVAPAAVDAVGRDMLVGGTYVPGAGTTGLLPGSTYTDVYGTTTDSQTGASYRTLPAGTYTRQRYWCQVRWSGPVTFIDCDFCGPDPAPIFWQAGHLTNFAANSSRATLLDCRISSTPWRVNFPGRPLAAGVVRTPSPWSFGIHGGNFDLKRVEIIDVQDGINYVQNGWIVGTTQSSCLIDRSWIHCLWYRNDWNDANTPSNHQTHNDCFQINNGKNITIRHSMLGGWREQSGYDAWPGGANTGDDAFSSILQFQQEVSDSAADRIENVLIEECWIDGAQYGINMYWRSRNSGQDFSTFTIRNVKFFERPASIRWGPSLNDPYESNPGSKNGAYFNKSSNAIPVQSGNVIVARSDPFTAIGSVPIRNAGNGS